jgi:hypothetical protein
MLINNNNLCIYNKKRIKTKNPLKNGEETVPGAVESAEGVNVKGRVAPVELKI